MTSGEGIGGVREASEGTVPTGMPALFPMPGQAVPHAGVLEGLHAVQSLGEHINDFARRALSVQETARSTALYLSRRDMKGYDEAMSTMEKQVRVLATEALDRKRSFERLMGHLRETRGSITIYASYIRTIGSVCRKLSLGRKDLALAKGESESFLDLAARDIFGIEESIGHITRVLDNLFALMEVQASGSSVKAEGLDAALDHALSETRRNRKELSARLEGSLTSIREFHHGWSGLTDWITSLRKAFRSSDEPAGDVPAPPGQASPLRASSRGDLLDGKKTGVPEQPRRTGHEGDAGLSLPARHRTDDIRGALESSARPVSGTDAIGLAWLARSMGEFCSGMRERVGSRHTRPRPASQAMKKALRYLVVSVEHYLAMNGEIDRAFKGASMVTATMSKALLEIENMALKSELMVLNACIHSGVPRGCSVLAGSMHRLSAITSSNMRFMGERLLQAAEEMDLAGAGHANAWKKIHFTSAFARVLEKDRDAWHLMESVLADAGALCRDMSACIEGAGPHPGDMGA